MRLARWRSFAKLENRKGANSIQSTIALMWFLQSLIPKLAWGRTAKSCESRNGGTCPLREISNMMQFRTVLLTSGLLLALCGGVAQAQSTSKPMLTLQMPALPDPVRVTLNPATTALLVLDYVIPSAFPSRNARAGCCRP